jgi:hypothetical protein
VIEALGLLGWGIMLGWWMRGAKPAKRDAVSTLVNGMAFRAIEKLRFAPNCETVTTQKVELPSGYEIDIEVRARNAAERKTIKEPHL